MNRKRLHFWWILLAGGIITSFLTGMGPEESASLHSDCDLDLPNLPDLVICEDNFDGSASFDFSGQNKTILDFLLEDREPTIYINEQLNGLLEVTGLDGQVTQTKLCNGFSFPVTDIAVDPNGQIYAVSNTSNTLYRLDPQTCQLQGVGSVPIDFPNSLSFDPAGNLYVGGAISSTVHRSSPSNLGSFSRWHDFGSGVAGGDFVLVKDKLYIAWSSNVTSETNLFEVTVDGDFNYVSHEDLGPIYNNTFGLASELGKLYGIAYNALYEIELPGNNTRLILNHPSGSGLDIGDNSAWWGGAGLHEASFEISYHLSQLDAMDGSNPIDGLTYTSTSNPQTIYFRVLDNLTGCSGIGEFDIIVYENPVIIPLPGQVICLDQDQPTYDLSVFDMGWTQDPMDMAVSYHRSEQDAESGEQPIDKATYAYSGTAETLYVRVENMNTACYSTTQFDLDIRAIPEISVAGSNSVCPFTEDVPYTLASSVDVGSYDWEVTGGTISFNGGDSITVDWGVTNASANIRAFVVGQNGCTSEVLDIPVIVNLRLEPEAPIGRDKFCFDDEPRASYSAHFVPGSQYQWFAENGTITGRDDQREVEVSWDADQVGKLYFREFNPSITQCSGISDTLFVEFLEEVQVQASITVPSCFGGNDGMVALTLPPQVTADRITWGGGETGLVLSDISAGTYSYTLLDNNGCTTTGEVIVEDHPQVAVATLESRPTSCFGGADGTLNVSGTGGVGDFRFRLIYRDQTTENQTGSFSGLEAGEYELEVIDANDCSASQLLTIDEPPELVVDELNIVNTSICPNTNDGHIEVPALGGTPPYRFEWDGHPNNQSNTLSGVPAGTYRLTVFDSNGCRTPLTVNVNEFIPRVFMPTAFSPNGDGNNDRFQVVVGCELNAFSMKVFNRWGNIVFYSDNQQVGWDGTSEGKVVIAGQYTYSISYSIDINDIPITETVRGNVRLVK